MKTNLFKRTLSFVIVACMLIAMVAVAPMASAAEVPALGFGMDVYEYDNNGTTEVRVSLYITGYDKWNFETEGIDMMQFYVGFDNTKLTFVTSMAGSGDYKAFTAPTGMTVTTSNAASATAANNDSRVVFMVEAGIGEDEETGDPIALYIPQGEKVYLRTYRFNIKEGAEGACNFTFDTAGLMITDYFHGMNKIVNKNFPETWTANNGVYTIASAAPEYYIDYLAGEGFGHMDPTVGTAPVIAAPLFTKAGYTFAGWVDAEGNKYEVGAVATQNLKLIATWTANATSNVANFYKMIGAQARTAESGKSAGMRFGVNVAGLVAGVEIQDKGILMIPTDLLNGAELTHDTPDYAVGTFNAAWNENGEEIYTAVLVNIPEGQYARPITARGFVKVNGVYYYTPAIERNYQAVLDTLSAMQ